MFLYIPHIQFAHMLFSTLYLIHAATKHTLGLIYLQTRLGPNRVYNWSVCSWILNVHLQYSVVVPVISVVKVLK